MHKEDRHNALLQLISSEAVSSQTELASRLCETGFKVTQASVSRDLEELGIVKIDGRYELMPRNNGISEFGSVSLETVGDNLIVGKCASGLASAITVRIDGQKIPQIVGTIAGDDTIFIAVKSSESQAVVISAIKAIFS
ncbi:arginine repressor [soil metagenome]